MFYYHAIWLIFLYTAKKGCVLSYWALFLFNYRMWTVLGFNGKIHYLYNLITESATSDIHLQQAAFSHQIVHFYSLKNRYLNFVQKLVVYLFWRADLMVRHFPSSLALWLHINRFSFMTFRCYRRCTQKSFPINGASSHILQFTNLM